MSTEFDILKSIPVTGETEEGFDLRGFIMRNIKYWPVLVILVLSSVILSYLYLRYTPKSYKADAMLAIKKDNELTGEGGLRISLMDDKVALEKEVELLKSPDAVEETVKRLALYADLKSIGRIQKKDLYANQAPFFIEAEDPYSLPKAGPLKATVDTTGKTVTVEGKKYTAGEFHNTPWGRLKFTINTKFADEASEYELSLMPVGMKSGEVAGRLSVDTKTKLSELIIMTIHDKNQQRAVDILNTLVKVYDEITVGTKKTAYSTTYKFIDERLGIVEKELSGVESEVQRFKANEGVFDLSTQGTAYLQSVQESDQRVAQLNLQLDLVDKARSAIRANAGDASAVPAMVDVGESPLTKQIEELNRVNLKLNEQLQLSGPENPRVRVLIDQRDKLRSDISGGLDNMKKNLETSRNFYLNKQAGFNSMLRGLPQKEKGLIDITRQQSIKNGIFSFLLQKREEAAISVAGTVPNSQFVRKAMPGGVLKPTAVKTHAMALMAALALFAAIVFLNQLIRDHFEDKKEAEKKIGAPIAGEIIQTKRKEDGELVVGDGKMTVEAEQFRDLRTNLSYLGLNDDHKVVLVTSSQPSEGKTFVSLNLAMSMALTGKKVALLGLDFRKPQLSVATQVSNKPGITDYLVGRNKLSEIIKPLAANPNIFILPAGSMPPNPTELIMDEKMGELIAELKKEFNFIIFDTPPIGAVTDAKILAKYANTTIYVMRYGHTERSFYPMIKDAYVNKKFPNMGLVLNGIKENKFLRYSQRYGYGYTKNS